MKKNLRKARPRKPNTDSGVPTVAVELPDENDDLEVVYVYHPIGDMLS